MCIRTPRGWVVVALHPCPRCKRLIPVGITYCDDCRPEAEAAAAAAAERRQQARRQRSNQRYNAKRSAELTRFYQSKEWRGLSRWYLESINYQCEARLEGCQRIACEVHHIKPVRTPDGWAHRLDSAGLMGLCTACHNRLEPRYGKTPPGVIDLKKLK